jgi:hypothetical protein
VPPPPASTAGPFTYTTGNRAVTITRYKGQGANVVLPDQINGLPVTGIGDEAFSENANLTEITIPASVATIGNRAFRKCPKLASMHFKGDAPGPGKEVFQDTPKATIDHLPATKGWDREFGGRPTKLWNPEMK